MKKLLILFFTLILFVSYAFGASINEQYMTPGYNVTLNGKNIIFLYPMQAGSAIFSVDGIWVKVPLNRTVSGNGADITMNEGDSSYAVVTITVAFNCGDSVCEGGESGSGTCCKDCGCLSGLACVENKCVPSVDNACFQDKDCSDGNICTKDLCSGTPRKCSNTLITTCDNNDGCCLSSCSIYSDSDCRNYCSTTQQCDDRDPCTTDSCTTGNCTNIAYGGCNVLGSCIQNTSTINGSYCLNAALSEQKLQNTACKYDFECVSYDCSFGRCKGGVAKVQTESGNGVKPKADNPILKYFADNNNIYLYIILGFALIVIIVEVKKYIKDKKEGY